MNLPTSLDYTQYPFSSPGSRLGLLHSPRFFGWDAARAHCDHYAKEVASPFLRFEEILAGRLECWPSRCVMRQGAVEASFTFPEPDAVTVVIAADHPLRAYGRAEWGRTRRCLRRKMAGCWPCAHQGCNSPTATQG